MLFCQTGRAIALACLRPVVLADNAAVITAEADRERASMPIVVMTRVAALLPFLVLAAARSTGLVGRYATRHQGKSDANCNEAKR